MRTKNVVEWQAFFEELEKCAFIAWGGRRMDFPLSDDKDSKVQGSLGYSNVLGLVPVPHVGFRFGSQKGVGANLSVFPLTVGVSSRASKSFRERSSMPALVDLLVNAAEDAAKGEK